MEGFFKLESSYEPCGDQPKAIDRLVESIEEDNKFTTLVGVTGSGKTYTIANVIERLQRPTLVISHNKTLAAQLCNEFKSFFPSNANEYFVSYYDYYQPEAYMPVTDTYIEKDSAVNQEIDRLRHSATQAVLLRNDVVVVGSVSAIYGLGSPQDYQDVCLTLEAGAEYDRDDLLLTLIRMQYERTEDLLETGKFRVRGGTVELIPSDRETVVKLDFFGDDLERITQMDLITGETIMRPEKIMLFPATHYVLIPERLTDVLQSISDELGERYKELRGLGRELEANRLWERTQYDMEMLREMGYCHGIENYSRHFDGRKPGEPPYTLSSYFPDDMLVVVDESHVTIPQLRAMCNGDRARKNSLVEFGFRLPSAYDNRPLNFDEFVERSPNIIFVSATPGPFELKNSGRIVEQIIRPTGLVDPRVEVKPIKGQMALLLDEIHTVVERNERALVTTLTKKMAEELTDYLVEKNVRARYMHSDIDTLDRIQIIYDLRRGDFDVLVGINLLREGLDLPEVSLVAILDADKEGFLRSATTLIQTMGRAARNVNGKVILFGDKETDSMKLALKETGRRRKRQIEYNKKYDIVPKTITKCVQDRFETTGYRVSDRRGEFVAKQIELQSVADLTLHVDKLEKEMWEASDRLDFETAAAIRDQINLIKAKKGDKPV